MSRSILLNELSKRVLYSKERTSKKAPRWGEARHQYDFYRGYTKAMSQALALVVDEFERDARKASRAAK